MALLDIITWPDERLKIPSEPVTEFDDELNRLIDDMADTMYAAPGVGLAGVQVGAHKRLFIIDTSPLSDDKNLQVFINPEIVEVGGDNVIFEEGCLSVPGYKADVHRHEKATIKYLDRHGSEKVVEADELLARALQHELNHLEGVLFFERLSRLKKSIFLRKLKKALVSGEFLKPLQGKQEMDKISLIG